MRTKKATAIIIALFFAMSLCLSGCGNSEEAENSEKDYLVVDTKIGYSSGSESEYWNYGDLRKEFPKGKLCYARIASIPYTEKFNKGDGDSIAVTYRFTGTKNCEIASYDGITEKKEAEDKNVTEFTSKIIVTKEKKQKENAFVFQYNPNKKATEVVLEVIYDDQINPSYDQKSTITFVK